MSQAVLPAPEGSLAQALLEIDTEKLKSPSLTAYVDECRSIMREPDGVEFAFGIKGDLIPRIRLFILVDELVRSIYPQSREYHEGTLTFLREQGCDARPVIRLRESEPEWERCPQGIANVVSMARTGMHSQFDCYLIKPRSARRAAASKSTVQADPVFSLLMPTSLTAGVLNEMRVAASGEPPYQGLTGRVRQ